MFREDLSFFGDLGDYISIFGLLMVFWCLGEDRIMCKGETGLSMSRLCLIVVGFYSVRRKILELIWEVINFFLYLG